MSSNTLLHEVLSVLYTVKEDNKKLEKVLQFLMDEIYEEPAEMV